VSVLFTKLFTGKQQLYFPVCLTMETGDDVEEPLGRITGHLDFNDNTHILGHRKMENTQKMQVSLSECIHPKNIFAFI